MSTEGRTADLVHGADFLSQFSLVYLFLPSFLAFPLLTRGSCVINKQPMPCGARGLQSVFSCWRGGVAGARCARGLPAPGLPERGCGRRREGLGGGGTCWRAAHTVSFGVRIKLIAFKDSQSC